MKRLALAIFVLALVVVSASFSIQTLNSTQPANVRTASPALTSLVSQNIATSLTATSFTRVSVGQSSAPSSQQAVSQSPSPVSSPLASPAGAYSTNLVSSSTSSSNTRRLGFWVGEGEIFSNLGWSAQTFVNNYFKTAPYPSTLLFASGGGYAYPQEANWLNQVLSITDTMNVKVILLCFVNLSGGTINGRPDQTSSFTTFMNSLKGHPSLYGAEFENEYFANTLHEESAFMNIVTGAGYTDILNPSSTYDAAFPTLPVLDYSEYPYFTGTIASSLYPSGRAIGVGYGETGAPSGTTPNPAWTQQSVTSIVNISPTAQFTFIYSEMGGAGQPFNLLWNWQTLRGWIWNDPNYQANYALSTSASSGGGSPPPAPPPTSPPPVTSGSISLKLNPTNPQINSWIKLTINGAPKGIALKVVITNVNTHKIVAILFPGTVSSAGSLSFGFQSRSSFLGSDTLSIYSMSSNSLSPIASLAFTVS